jgi:uncharacterized membrane protein
VPESVTHRCIKELSDKGLIAREPVDRGFANSLKDKCMIAKSMDKMGTGK